jgi:hypothetical protein
MGLPAMFIITSFGNRLAVGITFKDTYPRAIGIGWNEQSHPKLKKQGLLAPLAWQLE